MRFSHPNQKEGSAAASRLLPASKTLTQRGSFRRALLLALATSAGFSSAFEAYPRPVYIRSAGAYLPNEPICNEDLETHIGGFEGKGSRIVRLVRDNILKANGITSRHFAMKNEKPTHLNLDLAANAAHDALKHSDGVSLADVDMIATGTSSPDIPMPGFANLLHGKLGATHSVDCLSSAGVCTSSTNAMKAAVNAVALGQHDKALVCGSETASHSLNSQYLQQYLSKKDNPMSGLFLRYMLSDGAGCALLDTSPHPTGLSYRVDGFYHHSFAYRFPPCMMVGTTTGPGKEIKVEELYKFNDLHLGMRIQQDIELLKKNIIPLGKEALQYAIEKKGFPAEGVDWVVPHLSSHMFFDEFASHIHDVLGIEKDKIWTNLSSVGNVGAASMPLLLWGMLRDNPQMKKGDRVLVIIPESGNFSYHYILLTVV